jgi:uncharacterized protein (DUF1778 family)
MESSSTDQPKKILKVSLSEEEHKMLRLAAAVTELNLSEFARIATINAAKKAVEDFLASQKQPRD